MEGLSFENTEKPGWHYTYTNNDISDRPVIFECDAENILEADKKFEEKIGKVPDKENQIGCSIVRN